MSQRLSTEYVRDYASFLAEALINPKAALMHITLEIDKELRKLLVSTGALGRYRVLQSPTLPNGLEILASVEGAKVPEELKSRILEFWSLRNTVVHHDSEVPARAIELGLDILRVLKNVPRPSYIIRKANLPLYADQHCQVQREGVRGVWLESFGPDGVSQGKRIYPTTREYVEGMSVGWEWNQELGKRKGWNETWYKHPETGKCTLAWSGSLEFIGRDIDEV
jgi:hypothetical protein